MLIDVKVKVTYNIGDKKRKATDTYVVDKEFFSEAEYTVTQFLEEQKTTGLVDSFEIISLRVLTLKEVADQYHACYSYIVTLKDTYHDDGNEKSMRYKVLLWADNP